MKCSNCGNELDKINFLSTAYTKKINVWQTTDDEDEEEQLEIIGDYCSYPCAKAHREELIKPLIEDGTLLEDVPIHESLPIYRVSRCPGYYDCERLKNIRDICEDMKKLTEKELQEAEKARIEEVKKRQQEEFKKMMAELKRTNPLEYQTRLIGEQMRQITNLITPLEISSILATTRSRPRNPRCSPAEVAIIRANLSFIDNFEKFDKASAEVYSKMLVNLEISKELNEELLGHTTESSSINKSILLNAKESTDINEKVYKNLKSSSKLADEMHSLTIQMRTWAIVAVLLSITTIVLMIITSN